MIHLAIDTIGPIIKALPFVERYGGLTFEFVDRVKIGETANGDPIIRDNIYPVSGTLTGAQCATTGIYDSLAPNSQYKSLLYWEQLSTLKPHTPIHYAGGGYWYFTCDVRLIAWLDIAGLNINSDAINQISISKFIALSILEAVDEKKLTVSDSNFAGSSVTFRLISQPPKSAKLFSKYSYDKNTMSALMLKPYDFLGLDFKIDLEIKKDCINTLSVGNPVDCIEI